MRAQFLMLVLAVAGVTIARPRHDLAAAVLTQAPATVDFARDIQPLFTQHCVSCHGASQQMSGLRLDRRRDALRGSTNGVVIRPGNGEISGLYRMVAGLGFGAQMPPTGALKPEQIALIKQWVDEGAEWPDALAGDVAAPPVDPGTMRLSEAVRSRDRDRFTRALAAERPSINARGEDGTSPLMWAALEGDLEMVRALLDAGADPNLKNDAGATPLMWAIPELPLVSLLLERGANPNVKTGDGRTPLTRASGINGASALVARLLDAGGDGDQHRRGDERLDRGGLRGRPGDAAPADRPRGRPGPCRSRGPLLRAARRL